MREIVFLVSSFLVCWKGVYPFLDVDELKNIHYDIDIVDKPVLIGRVRYYDFNARLVLGLGCKCNSC